MTFFEEIHNKEIQFLFEDSFKDKNLNISEFVLLENGYKFLVNKRDRITVYNDKTWKLNGLNKGEIFGKSLMDVCSDYLFECSKDR